MDKNNKPKILFFVTEDWYFLSHRLPMARKAKELGFEVFVVTKINEGKEEIEKEGFKLFPTNLDRSGKNPIKEIKSLIEIIKIYNKIKPDLTHHVAMKPSIYGSVASFLIGTPAVINALAGMGTLFTSSDIKTRIIKNIVTIAFRFLLNRKNSRLIVQNDDDFEFFSSNKIVEANKIIKIRGSGVDVSKFSYQEEPPMDNGFVVAVVSRMLWNKGIGEVAKAGEILKEKGVKVNIKLIGDPDPYNPQTIDEEQLKNWNDKGFVEYLGRRKDIAKIYQEAHIALLPSYREGLPKSLLEGGACGRAMVATDVAGCRELVKNMENGILIKAKNPEAIAEAIEKLSKNKELRVKLGLQARKDIEEELSDIKIAEKTGELYSFMYDNFVKKGA